MSWDVNNVDDFYINVSDGFRSVDIKKTTVEFGAVSSPYVPMYWDKRPLGNTKGSLTLDYTVDTVAGSLTASATELQSAIETLLLSNGGVTVRTVRAVTVPGTALISDDVLECSGTGELALYTAVGNEGRQLDIKNIDTGVVTVLPDGIETIDGEANIQLVQYDSITIVSDGTNWIIT